MISFHLRSSTTETQALGELIMLHGGTLSRSADLILIGASSVSLAHEQIEQLSDLERARCLIVGLSEMLDPLVSDSPGNLASLLEETQPLGVLASATLPWRPEYAGFTGKRMLASAVGTTCFSRYTSLHYGVYTYCEGQDAGEFVLRYLNVARSCPVSAPEG